MLGVAYAKLARHALEGRLDLEVRSVPLQHADEAWERLRAGSDVKLVVTGPGAERVPVTVGTAGAESAAPCAGAASSGPDC